jgi:hypothetical protein
MLGMAAQLSPFEGAAKVLLENFGKAEDTVQYGRGVSVRGTYVSPATVT